MNGDLGRRVFGIAVIGWGLIALFAHNFETWQQLASLGSSAWIVAALEIAGGVAIQFRKTTQVGAAILAAVYLFFALRWLPGIIAKPLVYGRWGNMFEQLSLVAGAVVIYAPTLASRRGAAQVARVGRYLFAICVVSFTLEQLVYLEATAELVPPWMPPGQMFWAILTTVAFALAAIALLTGIFATLAARLTTAMIVVFGLLIWLPALVAAPHDPVTWGGNAQNLAICGAAWIVADAGGSASRLSDSPRRA